MNLIKVREWAEANSRRIMAAGLGFLMIGVGVFWWKTEEINQSEGVKILSSEIESEELMVDVEGAVARPGVFRLNNDARVNDAIISAGGLTEEADKIWVEKNLNKSAKVTDGMKVYIPRVEEQESGRAGEVISGQININTAGVGELDKLPGVGEVTAGKIIDGRPYTQAEELVQRKIVSQKVWEGIKERVTTW